MTDEELKSHTEKIITLRKEADALPSDNPMAIMDKIDLLSKCLVYIGRLSSHLDEESKKASNKRKNEYARVYLDAPRYKEATAELAIAKLRDEEAVAYGLHRRWRNAFESTQEEIHALKLRHRQDMQIDTFRTA